MAWREAANPAKAMFAVATICLVVFAFVDTGDDATIRSSVPSSVDLHEIAQIRFDRSPLGLDTLVDVAWSPNGRRLALAFDGGRKVVVLDTSTWRPVSHFERQEPDAMSRLAFLTDSELVVAPFRNISNSSMAFAVYEIETGRSIKEIARDPEWKFAPAAKIAITSSGKYIALLVAQGIWMPVLYDSVTGAFMGQIGPSIDAGSRALTVGPRDRVAIDVTHYVDRAKAVVQTEIQIIDTATNKTDRIISGRIPVVDSLAWSADGRWIASGGSYLGGDGKGGRVRDPDCIHIWDATTGELVTSFAGKYDPIERIAWHPSKPIIATASAKGGDEERGSAVHLWSVDRKEMLFEYKTPGVGEIDALSFDPHTGHLVWGSNGSLHVFEVEGLP